MGKRKQYGLAFFSILVFLFLAVPLFIIAATAFGEASTIRFPIKGFTLKWFAAIFASRSFMSSLRLSFALALYATALALLVGIPAAYALSKTQFRRNAFLRSFFLSPTFVPGIVVGYALFQFLVIKLRMPVFAGLLTGHFLVVLPYIIRVVGASLEQFDFSIEEVAWSLGCDKGQAFVKVVLPNIASGIVAAFMLAFINSFNNIPVSMFLTGPGVSTLPTTLMTYIEYSYDPSVSAISVLLMLTTIVLMFIVEKTLGIGTLAK
ncbi:MAG: spermidine/putrescine ABC transporter ATP-binding protein [Treponema sp. GWB1_62_6]|nr:MAG: spermidine/putrescine ABC transporter ATP-binding protein [Treponema sp. GWC1_61_84]OHE63436.1 MAG: spermidine/putrescine ABC transporter ATP-binding protein [Treponema sp. GWB1_62_6]OHE76283.1 MAG: spermidine/putrescine ABC transporter ATP-binding protein [Treponema sp. RIFOXYC1_FULL_61_9]HCM28811.1 spermidine/putrescine ABC transporter ATP-binding protein [Treponema sp.]